MKSYLNDLKEQNEVLVATVGEIEREANDKIDLLEVKLQKKTADVKVKQF